MVVSDEQKIQLMAFLDGEMEATERAEFEKLLLQEPELQQQMAQFQKLQTLVQKVRVPEPKLELWDEHPRKNPERMLHIVGWVLFLFGVLIVALFCEYSLWCSPLPFIFKMGLTLIITGLVVLLGSVFFRRKKESKTDRYKEIVR